MTLSQLYTEAKRSRDVADKFDFLLVCPDTEDADYNACANAVACPRLAQGDGQISWLMQNHKVDHFPMLIPLAEDATEITKDGFTEMNPPPGGG